MIIYVTKIIWVSILFRSVYILMISEIFYKSTFGLYLVPLSMRHMGNHITNSGPKQVLPNFTDLHSSSQTPGSIWGRIITGHSYLNGSQLAQTLYHMDKSVLKLNWNTWLGCRGKKRSKEIHCASQTWVNSFSNMVHVRLLRCQKPCLIPQESWNGQPSGAAAGSADWLNISHRWSAYLAKVWS